jgi:hypothetical protein
VGTSTLMSADVTFFFDPNCPFTWRTSRWLRSVTQARGHSVDWRLMSLKILNEGQDAPEERREWLDQSIRPVRVLFAARERLGVAALDRLYTEFGTRLHYQGAGPGDDLIKTALAAAELPDDLIDAANDESLDAAVKDSHNEGQARVGQESGSPIIAIGDGPGFFGPVVVPPPSGESAERLYDAVQLLSAVPEFSELKRKRASL